MTPFPATRVAARQQLAAFVPLAGRYSRDRNAVLPGHPNVSRLSPAIRHGLITPAECEAAVLARFAPSTVEKFVQELHWRQYWKAWLSLRPQVWDEYRQSLASLQSDPAAAALRERAERCATGESNLAIMNHFARELTSTGYLHNHARMWFAGWWIHVERLPWELGADFFFHHLLDADPASNTLSWRWVAGLQTPGKTYLPRRSNLEKYLAPEILAEHSAGLELLENPQAVRPDPAPRPQITRPDLDHDPIDPTTPTGLWIHEEDLRPEHGPLSKLTPTAIIAAGLHDDRPAPQLPDHRRAWLDEAFADARSRAATHFHTPVLRARQQDLATTLHDWAAQHKLTQIIAIRPEIGPLHDRLGEIKAALATSHIRLRLVHHPEFLALRPLATAGFFGFWKNAQRSSDKIGKPTNH